MIEARTDLALQINLSFSSLQSSTSASAVAIRQLGEATQLDKLARIPNDSDRAIIDGKQQAPEDLVPLAATCIKCLTICRHLMRFHHVAIIEEE